MDSNELLKQVLSSIEENKNKQTIALNRLIIACIVAICFVSLLFTITMWHIVDEMYNYDYPDMDNTNTNVNVNGGNK